MAICHKHLRAYHSLCMECVSDTYPDVYTKVKEMKEDKVNNPSHYNKGKIECIDAIAQGCSGLEGFEAVCTGNDIKYLWRWKHKNGIEDLEKAKWYIERLIAYGTDDK